MDLASLISLFLATTSNPSTVGSRKSFPLHSTTHLTTTEPVVDTSTPADPRLDRTHSPLRRSIASRNVRTTSNPPTVD
ncbi:hypothetical protein QC762_0018900 [Podospora pseudocomata]|uniref:Uncharacterized protein n=1 Tax=Podospora pseudocomata TaxID=2093779 RepID=A0ABR0GXD8_9PEZI|nr:hypothetical protein QC762_0018900 [Podospora pseudocomata]